MDNAAGRKWTDLVEQEDGAEYQLLSCDEVKGRMVWKSKTCVQVAFFLLTNFHEV